MKPPHQLIALFRHQAAAFGRLCVETFEESKFKSVPMAAAFGRLCVETGVAMLQNFAMAAAAFGRLCVETLLGSKLLTVWKRSRLRAAVC